MRNLILIAAAWTFLAAMALADIVVTASNQHLNPHLGGEQTAEATLTITGLTQNSDNTVPHGLPRAPFRVSCTAQEDGTWYEKQSADATNLYIHSDTSGPTKFRCDVEY